MTLPKAGPAQPENRRARRAAASTSRKKGHARHRAAAASAKTAGLDAGEMVDDALSRAADGSARWIKNHFNIVQWLIVASVAGWIGWQIYSWRSDKTAVKISDSLSEAVDAEFGRIGSPDDEGKVDARGSVDTRRVFSTDDDRLKATAADSYQACRHGARRARPAADLRQARTRRRALRPGQVRRRAQDLRRSGGRATLAKVEPGGQGTKPRRARGFLWKPRATRTAR